MRASRIVAAFASNPFLVWVNGACALMALLFSLQTGAHETGLTQVNLSLESGQPRQLEVSMELIELELVLGLDQNSDGRIVWSEYVASQNVISQYIQVHFSIGWEGFKSCRATYLPDQSGVLDTEVPAVRSVFTLECGPASESLVIRNQLLASIDSKASALLHISGSADETVTSAILLPQGETRLAPDESESSSYLYSFFSQGFHHILEGFDHLAFLLVLLLPVARQGKIRMRLLAITGIVTAFTLAHSVTLVMATVGYIDLPGAIVETIIAGSVVVAALMNIFHPACRTGVLLAYAFGLVHGFGFAGALDSLSSGGNLQILDLLAFNLGVEAGQLAVVLLVLPLLALMGSPLQYRRYVVPAGSACIAAAGCFWMAERIPGLL